MFVNIHEPHQIIRTTDRTGSVVHSWVVTEDGNIENHQIGIRAKYRDPDEAANEAMDRLQGDHQ